MGAIEEKHKRIYILHTFVPKASYHSRSRLRLSTNGWKQEYNKVCKRTASILQYLGDWHSHPQGSLEMSVTDVLTCYEIKTEEINSKYGICLISNTHETIAYILTDEMTIVIAKQENVQ